MNIETDLHFGNGIRLSVLIIIFIAAFGIPNGNAAPFSFHFNNREAFRILVETIPKVIFIDQESTRDEQK
jgi:hypothetical protein